MESYDSVTTIAIYDGQTVRTYVRGRNLDAFAKDIQAYRLLITYNGKSFDQPLLETRYRMSRARPPFARLVLRGRRRPV